MAVVWANRIAMVNTLQYTFAPTAIAALMAAAFLNTVAAASTFQSNSTRNLFCVKNGKEMTQHTDALKTYYYENNLWEKYYSKKSFFE